MMKILTDIFFFLMAFLFFNNALAQTEQPQLIIDTIGIIEVETSNGVVRVITGGGTLKWFKRRVKADDLFRIVSERLDTTTEPKLKCDDEMLFAAIHLLTEAKDARVLYPLLQMSKSPCPHSCDSAAFGLQSLGDKRALPRLLEILRKTDACSWAVVRAIGKIGDETAIPDLIDSIPDGGAMDAEARLKAIEEITGLSLDGIRKEWGLLYYGKLEQFHKAMHEWWQSNKHLAKRQDKP
jgi:PBS lyase HEAT-like repeat